MEQGRLTRTRQSASACVASTIHRLPSTIYRPASTIDKVVGIVISQLT